MFQKLKQTLCFILIFTSVSFIGCKQKDKFLDLNVYLNNKVYYSTILSPAGEDEYYFQLNKCFNQNSENLNQYSEIKFETIQSYSYDLTLHYIQFCIYSTSTEEVEFLLTVTNLKNANYDAIYNSNCFKKSIPCNLIANNYITIKIEVEDIFADGISKIILTNNDQHKFLQNTQLKYNICDLKISAEHIL